MSSGCSLLLPAHPASNDAELGDQSTEISLLEARPTPRGVDAVGIPAFIVRPLAKAIAGSLLSPVVRAVESEASRYTQSYAASAEIDASSRVENGSILLFERRVADRTAMQFGLTLERSSSMIEGTFLLRPRCLYLASTRAKVLDQSLLNPLTWFAGGADSIELSPMISVDSIWRDAEGIPQRVQENLSSLPTLVAPLPETPGEPAPLADVAATNPVEGSGGATERAPIVERFEQYCEAHPIDRPLSELPLLVLRTSDQVPSKAIVTLRFNEQDPSRAQGLLRRLLESADRLPDRAAGKAVEMTR